MSTWRLETTAEFDRVVVEFRDEVLVIVAIGLGHRSEIYRNSSA
jgi:hypothetical protein